jgi:hypothetical protein
MRVLGYEGSALVRDVVFSNVTITGPAQGH